MRKRFKALDPLTQLTIKHTLLQAVICVTLLAATAYVNRKV